MTVLVDRAASPTVPVRRGRLALLVGGAVLLILSVGMYWNVWTTSPTHSVGCPCVDPSLFAWLFEWAKVAILGGHNPFFSTAMFHPQGINLLSNTGMSGLTIPAVPLTALFGPVVSLNIVLVASPVLTGLAAMWVAQRWVRSQVVALLVGVLYAFSPTVISNAGLAHLNLTFLAIPPLVLAAVDELFWRRQHSPIKVGIALGLLLTYQFFISTEVLVMMLVVMALSLAVLGIAAWIRDGAAAKAALREGLPGFLLAGALCVVLLAWPAYYALAGPEHLAGPIWPNIPAPNASIRSFLLPVNQPRFWWEPTVKAVFRPTLLGAPLVLTLLIGVIVLRRNLRLVALTVLTALSAWLTLGARYKYGLWHWIGRLPLLHSVFNERFASLMVLPAALALALILDSVRRWRDPLVGTTVAVLLAAACAAPFALDASRGLPYPSAPVWIPTWYQRNASSLPPNQVVLGFPFPTTSQDLLAVQALHAMHYSIAGGTTPEEIISRQRPVEAGYQMFVSLGSKVTKPDAPTVPISATTLTKTPTPFQRRAVLAALRYWHVDWIVVPMVYETPVLVGNPPALVTYWLTLAIGAPHVEDGAWVWHIHDGHVLRR